MNKLLEIMSTEQVDLMEEAVAIEQRKEQVKKQQEKINNIRETLTPFQDLVIQKLVFYVVGQGGIDYNQLKPFMADEYERLAVLLKPRLAKIWEIVFSK